MLGQTNLPQAMIAAFDANRTDLDTQHGWFLDSLMALGQKEDEESHRFTPADGW